MFYVQFRHAYFGWLTLDSKAYPTRAAAEYAAKVQLDECNAYPRRVIRLQ